jgi:serine/threonine protein kinase
MEREGKKCVKFRHRDSFYPEKEIVFLQKEDDWFRLLKVFQESSILENYLKLERIGKGNFSNVYRCKSKNTDSYAALKIIEPKKLTPGERDVLKREIGILKQCHHPNIVRFIEEYKTNTHIYIVTELLSEGDLFDYTRKKSFLEEYEASVIFKQLTEAILYLNEMGIIHRDLKPENIMVLLILTRSSWERGKRS